MGNRAAVVFPEAGVSVYLHWNGGPESVYAFLEYAKSRGIRTDNYGPARFCQIVGNFMGGTLSLGIYGMRQHDARALELLDSGDNGVYVVRGWIVERRYAGSTRRWFTSDEISAEAASVRKSSYWNDPEETILQAIARKNDPHFIETEAAKAAAAA